MATHTAASAASTAAVRGHGFAGTVSVATGSIELNGKEMPGDDVQFCRLPAGARILGGYFVGEGADITLGWSGNIGTGDYDAAHPEGLGKVGGGKGMVPITEGLLAEGRLPYFTRQTMIQGKLNGTPSEGLVTLVIFYNIEG